jgi:cysteine desulfuration protein SufE
MTTLPSISDLAEEYGFLDSEDRYRLLIDLGRKLEPMPDALKTDATKVRGCSASVWVYPTQLGDGRLHFLADSNAAITKGVVALILAGVQDRPAAEVAEADIAALLAPFDLSRELSSNRTQGVPNMIALVHDTARRLATA